MSTINYAARRRRPCRCFKVQPQPPDDRWIKTGKNIYELPRDKMTKDEKKSFKLKVKKLKSKKIIKSIMDDIIDNVAQNIKQTQYKLGPLKKTNESQGHGKPVETEVLCKIGFCPEKLKKYKQNEKYDGKKEDSPDNRNKSIKTTGKNAPDCGDIIRFLTSDNMDIIIICYKQEGDYKIFEKTITVNFDSIIKVIKEEFNGEEGFNEWIKDIKDYIQCVKDAPKKTRIKELPCKKTLEFPYFGVRPKTDQNRVQCELKLEKILPLLKEKKDYKTEVGAFIDGKPYTAKIYSPSRDRNSLTIDRMKKFAKSKGINGLGKRGGWSNMKKSEILSYIISKGYAEDEIKNFQ